MFLGAGAEIRGWKAAARAGEARAGVERRKIFCFFLFGFSLARADLDRIAPRDTAFKRRPGSSTARAGSSDQI